MKTRLKEQSLKRILLIMASILLLSMLIPLSLCADQNNSTSTLSGLVFNDVNGNGERALSSEKGLGNWTVYVDLNRNYKQDNGDLFNQSDSSGYYIIANIPNGTYTVREIVKDGWTKTTQNSDRIKFFGPDKLEMNFGNRENKASSASSTLQDELFLISSWGAFAGFFVGIIFFILGMYKCKAKELEKDLLGVGLVLAGVILIIIGAYLLNNLEKMAGISVPGLSSTLPSIPMWLMLMIFVLLFIALLGIGVFKPEQMEGGQMRRAIAGLLVFGFVTILMFALYGTGINDNNKDVISQYIQLVGIIIGFYFGAKITTDAKGKMSAEYDPTKTHEDPLEIGDPSLNANNEIEIPLRNKSGLKIVLDKIHLLGQNLDAKMDLKTEILEDKKTITVDPKDGTTNEEYTIYVWLADKRKVEKVVLPKL
jgi:hypothetical protein